VIPGKEKGKWLRPMAFSPDGKSLALEGSETVRRKEGAVTHVFTEYRVRLWDLTTGQERGQFDARPDVIWNVAFTPDSKTMAAARMGGMFSVWEVATGQLRRDLRGDYDDTRPDGSSNLAFSADGTYLASIGGGNTVRVWDVAAGRDVLDKYETHRSTVAAAAFSPDGRILASASADHTIRFWDPATGKQLLWLQGHKGAVRTLAFSPDGTILASSAGDDTVRLWQVATGKELHQLKEQRTSQSGMYYNFGVRSLSFTPDGKILAAWGEDRKLRRWDVATGKELLMHQLRLSGMPAPPDSLPRESRMEFPDDHVGGATFTPGGKTIVLASNKTIHIADVATGQELFTFAIPQHHRSLMVLAPDSQILAVGGWSKQVCFWELATGKELLKTDNLSAIDAVAFTPDGRFLAAASAYPQAVINLLDVTTGKVVLTLQGHGTGVDCLAFSPDGRRLVSGQRDTTLLVWDVAHVTRRPAPPAKELSAKELDQLWADLAGADAPKAHTAIWTLSARPKQAVLLLNERLQPAAPTDPKHIQKLITDLDSSTFSVREAAAKELKKLGLEAEPALRQALIKNPSLEVRRRVETLLSTPAPWVEESPEALRRLRAVQVLAHIGNIEAQQVLATLAKGAPTARATREAALILERLANQTAAPP
jgi:WD40 repeat protein